MGLSTSDIYCAIELQLQKASHGELVSSLSQRNCVRTGSIVC